jgi:hypothetical protein
VALAPDHLGESLGLGLAFALCAGSLALSALVLRQPRHDSWAPQTAGAVLGLTALAYALSRGAGLPWLIPHALAATLLITRKETQ